MDADFLGTRYIKQHTHKSIKNASRKSGEYYLPDVDNLTDIDLYWAGYFRADGSLSRNGIACFSQVHQEPVERFARYLGLPGESTRGYDKITKLPGGTVSAPLVVYIVWAQEIGKVYAKMQLKDELRDKTLYLSRHFWRGLIDGDGSIQINKQGGASIKLSGRHEDVQAFSRYIGILTGRPTGVSPVNKISTANVTCDRAKFVARYFYLGQYSALDYKREKAEAIAAQPYSFTHKIALMIENARSNPEFKWEY